MNYGVETASSITGTPRDRQTNERKKERETLPPSLLPLFPPSPPFVLPDRQQSQPPRRRAAPWLRQPVTRLTNRATVQSHTCSGSGSFPSLPPSPLPSSRILGSIFLAAKNFSSKDRRVAPPSPHPPPYFRSRSPFMSNLRRSHVRARAGRHCLPRALLIF